MQKMRNLNCRFAKIAVFRLPIAILRNWYSGPTCLTLMKTEASTRLRLGAFELNLKTGELCALEGKVDGRKVLLQEQPFRVLQILIDCGGEIATRKEIKKRLWPNDTVVDFDHNINVAIGTLRRAFGDSAGNPRYIETIARRGYRLMVPVIFSEPDEADLVVGLPVRDSELRPRSTTLVGIKVSHFRVIEIIGGGGMGMVYKAEDLKLGRMVALKFLPEDLADDPLALRRFEREAQTASSLNHSNICTIFEIEEFEGQPIIVMELLDGETLRDRLAAPNAGRMSLEQILEVALQTCDGLQAAHSKGIVHRDVKPANIFLTRHGPAKILDFGLAKLVEAEELAEPLTKQSNLHNFDPEQSREVFVDDRNLTRTGMAMGTASYMSPEQIRKEKLDARTDLFSFGLVLYEMATGQRAFPGDNATGVQDALLNRTPIPVHDLNPASPSALEEVIRKALTKDRNRRYQSAAEIRADLERVPTPKKLRMRRIRNGIGIAAAVLAVVGGGLALYRYVTRYQLSAADTIVIADLTNQTSDTVLDDALNFALPVELSQTPFLQVLAQDKVRETMRQLHHAQDGKMTQEIGREVCVKTNSKALITSSISDVGNHFHIGLKGINCQSGDTFAQAERDAPLRSDIVHVLGVAGAELRRRMGEPAQSIDAFNKPLELTTSSSPEALQHLARGFRLHASSRSPEGIPEYERAIELDPSLALAHASVGILYLEMGKLSQATSSEKRAYEFRDRLTGQLKYLAETLYFDVGIGDLERSYPIYQEWVTTFPLDGVAHQNFSGCLFRLGHYDEAAAQAREARRLMPLMSMGSDLVLISSSISAGHLAEAKALYADSQARKDIGPTLYNSILLIHFLEGDEQGLQELLRESEVQGRNANRFILPFKSDAYRGRFSEASFYLRAGNEAASKSNNPVFLQDMLAGVALEQAEVGSLVDSDRTSSKVNLHNLNRNTRLLLALALARAEKPVQAEELAHAIEQEAPYDTLVQKFSLPTIRAAIQLEAKHPEKAISLLEPVRKYEFAWTESFDYLYPAYERGLAYLQLRKGAEAAIEFHKLLDHPGIVKFEVIGALSHLQLGRAEILVGDKASARKAYQDFFAIWKNADPNIAIYKQAKAEYAAL